MALPIQNTYSLTDIESLFIPADQMVAEKSYITKLASLQEMPHSKKARIISLAVAIIGILAGILVIYHCAGSQGNASGLVLGSMGLIVGCVAILNCIRYLYKNKLKKEEDEKNIEQYKKEAQVEKEKTKLKIAEQRICERLTPGEFFIVHESLFKNDILMDRSYRVYFPYQIGELKSQHFLPHSGMSLSISMNDFNSLVDRKLHYFVTDYSRFVLSNEELLKRKPIEREKLSFKSNADLSKIDETFDEIKKEIKLAKSSKNQDLLDLLEINLCTSDFFHSKWKELFKYARENGLHRLEEACFYSIIWQIKEDSSFFNELVEQSKNRLIRVPSKLSFSWFFHNLQGVDPSRLARLFDFSLVKQIICDASFNKLEGTLSPISAKLTNLEHISVRTPPNMFELLLPDSIDYLLKFLGIYLPHFKILEFSKSSPDKLKLVRNHDYSEALKNTNLQAFPCTTLAFVNNTVSDTDALFKLYKIKL